MNFGLFEGLWPAEAREKFPAEWADWARAPTETKLPSGEAWPEVRARTLEATAAIAAQHRGATVAIVAHGGPLRALLTDALGMDDRHLFRLDQSHGAVSVLDRFSEGAVVRMINYCPA
jgi:broad specificity phosphatase PhoE